MSDDQTDTVIDPLDAFDFKDPFTLLDGIDSDKVIAFFGLISRIEYALLLIGHVSAKTKWLQADWVGFAESMSGKLLSQGSKKLQESVEYLSKYPPKQYLAIYKWEPRNYKDGLSADSLAILAAKDVRHNLFHGLKLSNPDLPRNNELIEAAYIVLRGCLMANPRLNDFYSV
ncbi:TPA: hypothetical protein RK250_000838 [Klebsiella oxytoca]|uniref:hypothetical protein n=1 Tax=Klebsiella oxytoca TaxID=571 RepID=UPI0021E5EF46|nr:hypothetical protein [Klebsiella oxytoca]UYH03483.1 hypothetical protein NQA44_19985 [Klebsiella oxytoca]HDW1387290.1 hypothetical protein [Klebsiella oxytoca]HDW1411519.1 hypothetical protein [Klebsiella oxytoca]HEC2075137.1 hypothetical protein [Klebsiella oxytoca]